MATLCLIHGKWHEPSSWEPLAAELEARGHAVIAPDLPLDREATYDERAQPAIDALVGADDPVVVVAHSLGAAYAPLVAIARPVALIIYLCPAPTGLFNADAGMDESRAGFPWPTGDVWEPETAIAVMYPRLDSAVAADAATKLRPGARSRGDYPLSEHPDTRAAVIYAAADEFFEPEWERWAARNVVGVEPIEIPCGHFPMLEQPAVLAGLIDGLIR